MSSAPNNTEAKPVEMVNVQIDGKWFQFPKGTRMIEACRQAKAEVPHYCYHPKLTSPGNCRMCLVEMGMPPRLAPGENPVLDEHGHADIQWMPRPAIACANTVADGMGIRTNSTLTTECRKGVMEFLLINHPLDCPICDQAGECKLQEHSVQHGQGESRFSERKVKKPKNVDIGPRIRLDDERCIMCSRCIRFCKEVVDDDVLGFIDRGSHTKLTVHPGKRLENNYSLNTADICPVGALTSNDFRFQMRVWFMKETESICTSCGRGCNTVIGSREDEVLRITPRNNNAVNSDWMCDHGRLNYHYLNSPTRLTQPLLRSGADGFDGCDWPPALQAAADRLKTVDPGKTAVIASARLTNEELFLLKRLATKLSVSEIDIVTRLEEDDGFLMTADRNPNTNGARSLLLGDHAPGTRLNVIREGIQSGDIRGLIVWQEDLAELGFSKETLSRLDVLVVSHIESCHTADAADVVLPGAGFAEKRGTMINAEGRLQRLNPAVQPPGEARADWEVLLDLVQTVGGGNGIHSIEEILKAMAADHSMFAGLSWGRIGATGVPVMDSDVGNPLLEQESERVGRGEIVG